MRPQGYHPRGQAKLVGVVRRIYQVYPARFCRRQTAIGIWGILAGHSCRLSYLCPTSAWTGPSGSVRGPVTDGRDGHGYDVADYRGHPTRH